MKAQVLALRYPILDADGDPLAGGTVDVYATGTTTRVTTYSDSGLSVANANPILIPGSGRVSCWVDRDVDLVFKNDAGSTVLTESSVNPRQGSTAFDSGLVPNGSFETIAATGVQQAEGWTLDVGSSDNCRRIQQPVTGAWAYRFTGAAADGGEIVTAEPFEVNDVEDLIVSFYYYGSTASLTATAILEWYDASDSSLLNSTILNVSTVPTSYTQVIETVTPPTNARFARLRLTGVVSPESGSVYFDGVRAEYAKKTVPTAGAGIVVAPTATAVTLAPHTVNRYYRMTGSVDVTIPTGSFSVGSWFMVENAATTVNVAYDSGVTFNGSAGAGTYSIPAADRAYVVCVGDNVWEGRSTPT